MKELRPLWLTALVLASAVCARADCLPYDQAPKHVGEIVCIRGRVLKVSVGQSGTHYLNFCENFVGCPFSVVVFAGHLEEVGDVRSLAQQEIEIDGLVKLYNGRPEIILSDGNQLHGEAASHIPPLPKKYDVEQHGHFSPGTFRGKKPKSSKTKNMRNAGTDPMSDPSDPD